MRLITLLVLLLITLPLAAQKKASKERSCRIIYLRAPSGAPTKLQLFDGKTSQEVKLPRMNLSQRYSLPPGELTIHMTPEPVAEPKKLPKGAPRAVVPANVRDFYLLVTTDSKNTVAPVHLQLINANAKRFNNGQILWFNLSPHTINGTVGNQTIKLPPKSRRLMKPPTSKREQYPIDLSYLISGDKRNHPLCETSWLHDPRSRMLAFVFTEKNRRTPRVLAFPDFRPPPEKNKGKKRF